MRNGLVAMALLAFVVFFHGVATADNNPFANSHALGTPDGIPPSQEDVCSSVTGAAFGLCNAFCEAMDCDSPTPQASETACNRVKSQFQALTGSEPPCLQTCICNTALPGFLDAVNSTITFCSDLLDIGFVGLLTSDSLVPGSQAFEGFNACGFAFQTGDFLLITEEEALQCNDFLRAKAAEAGVACVNEPPF